MHVFPLLSRSRRWAAAGVAGIVIVLGHFASPAMAAMGAPSAVSAAAQTSGMNPATPVIYVSEPSNNVVAVFAQTGNLKTPLRTITDQIATPLGMWVDQKQNLYVTNTNPGQFSGYILVFRPGASKATQRIAVTAQYGAPTQIWVDSSGTYYVVVCGGTVCHIARRDSAGNWSHVTDPQIPVESGIVGDNQGNLYAAGYSGLLNGGIVEALFSGSKTWQTIGFPFILQAGQLAFDLLGRLTIADADVGNIFSYQLSNIQLVDAFRCYSCASMAFDGSGHKLWSLSATTPSTLSEFFFPGGAPEKAVQLPVAGYALAASPAFAPPPPSALKRPARGNSLRP